MSVALSPTNIDESGSHDTPDSDRDTPQLGEPGGGVGLGAGENKERASAVTQESCSIIIKATKTEQYFHLQLQLVHLERVLILLATADENLVEGRRVVGEVGALPSSRAERDAFDLRYAKLQAKLNTQQDLWRQTAVNLIYVSSKGGVQAWISYQNLNIVFKYQSWRTSRTSSRILNEAPKELFLRHLATLCRNRHTSQREPDLAHLGRVLALLATSHDLNSRSDALVATLDSLDLVRVRHSRLDKLEEKYARRLARQRAHTAHLVEFISGLRANGEWSGIRTRLKLWRLRLRVQYSSWRLQRTSQDLIVALRKWDKASGRELDRGRRVVRKLMPLFEELEDASDEMNGEILHLVLLSKGPRA